MSVDQRIREGLLMTNTELPQPDTTNALDAVTTLGHRNGRRRALVAGVAAAAVAATIAGTFVLTEGPDDDRSPTPAGPSSPEPSASTYAEQVIANGALTSFAVDASGAVLTVWSTCEELGQTDCGAAWRLDAGAEEPVTGLATRGDVSVDAYASGSGFVLAHHYQIGGLIVASDGTTRKITRDCGETDWPAAPEPGRYLVAWGAPYPKVIDTVTGSACDTGTFATALGEATYADDGRLWGVVGGSSGRAGTRSVARRDVAGWHYHELPEVDPSVEENLAVAGPNVVALRGTPYSGVVGLSVSADSGETWSDLPADAVPFDAFESFAFAGSSVLYVADGPGNLWRSTDLTHFSEVDVPGPVVGLAPAGNAVAAQVGAEGELVLIGADGTVDPLEIP